MESYLFILGRTPDLALLELKTFFPDTELVSPDIALCTAVLPLPPDEVLISLGGTVKIAQKLGEAKSFSPETIASYVDTSHGRTVFGVSVYGEARTVNRKLLEDVKMLLEGRGASVRFIEARGETLSSVVIQKNAVQEIILVKAGDAYIVGRTLAVQPFEAWNARDFGRPFADPKAGMLPPKVSRMAVNIADRVRDMREPRTQKTLLDPFCGMGTIPAEALVMGWNAVGTDQSPDIVEKCRANLRWITQKHLIAEGVTYRLESSDAVHVSDILDHESIDAIVTEPFMGKAVDSSKVKDYGKDVKNTLKGLEKLYIGCLKDWHKILKPQGVVMMALPTYAINGKTYFVKKVIDMCENLGYTIQAGPIEYGRPQAVVRRVFYLFRKN